jgi:hypothetical protein
MTLHVARTNKRDGKEIWKEGGEGDEGTKRIKERKEEVRDEGTK